APVICPQPAAVTTPASTSSTWLGRDLVLAGIERELLRPPPLGTGRDIRSLQHPPPAADPEGGSPGLLPRPTRLPADIRKFERSVTGLLARWSLTTFVREHEEQMVG